jgi:hypothetical protein
MTVRQELASLRERAQRDALAELMEGPVYGNDDLK